MPLLCRFLDQKVGWFHVRSFQVIVVMAFLCYSDVAAYFVFDKKRASIKIGSQPCVDKTLCEH